jgi:hypothetical protein
MLHPAAALRPAGRLQDVSCCADKSGAVIVGGGPVGLAAALMLSRRGWKDITVVEQQSSVTFVNPDRSYGELPQLLLHTACMCCLACSLAFVDANQLHNLQLHAAIHLRSSSDHLHGASAPAALSQPPAVQSNRYSLTHPALPCYCLHVQCT